MNSNTDFFEKFRKHHVINVGQNLINKKQFYICKNQSCDICIFKNICDKYNDFTCDDLNELKIKYPEDFV